MKKHIFLFIFSITTALCLQAQNPFVTEWNTTKQNPHDQLSIFLLGDYSYYWESISSPGVNGSGTGSGTFELTVPTPGLYRVEITPFGNNPIHYTKVEEGVNNLKLTRVENWGDIQWSSLESSFHLAIDVQFPTDETPDLSEASSMKKALSNIWAGQIPLLNDWDVSNVKDMSELFAFSTKFKTYIEDWDVGNVKNMSQMFYYALEFNQPLNNWDVSNVENMSDVFNFARAFNQPLDNWDVSKVTDMSRMFSGAWKFNQPLNNWDVSNVENMSGLFEYATAFNQPLDQWDVSKVTNMHKMFSQAYEFDRPLNNWDVSNVTDMSYMLAGLPDFNYPLDNWDVSNVENMNGIFQWTANFNQPLDNWNVSKVNQSAYAFQAAYNFNQPLSSWNMSNVTTIEGMFSEAHAFNQPIGNWDVSKVEKMAYLFDRAFVFNQPLNDWDVSSVTDMHKMFEQALVFNQPLNKWDVSNVRDMDEMFLNAHNFDQNLGSWKLNSMTDGIITFDHSGMSCENYSLTLKGWANNPDLASNVRLEAAGISYSPEAQYLRDFLINEKNWTITGDHPGNCALDVTDLTAPEISIYPNPASDFIRIGGLTGKAKIQITDLNGRKLHTTRLDSTNEVLDIQSLEKGVYILQITLENGEKISKKVVKK